MVNATSCKAMQHIIAATTLEFTCQSVTMRGWIACTAGAEIAEVHLQGATDIDGVHVPMSRYAGRLVVVANVASEDHVRGYTVQVRMQLVEAHAESLNGCM